MKFVIKSVGIILITIVLLGTGLLVASNGSPVYAMSLEELQVKIQTLLAQIAILQTSLQSPSLPVQAQSQIANTSIPSSFQFVKTLKIGSRGTDVRYLQILLNKDTATRVTVPGSETEYFGRLTEAGVRQFQRKYESEILSPAGLSFPTGTVDSRTRAKLNALLLSTRTEDSPALTTTSAHATSQPVAPTIASSLSLPVKPISFEDINTKTRKALVNIICTTAQGGSFSPLSGSGVIIDDRGIILTNAHVAEYFLLKDYLVPNFIDCVIRTGEPARNAYKAQLMYISPLWIKENYKTLAEDTPSGTGEHDFALLLITSGINPNIPVPKEFPMLDIDSTDTALKTPRDALVAAYPAGFFGGVTIQRDLYPMSSLVRTGKVFSFDGKTIDTFSIGGSPVAQHGSSGGGVISAQGKLIGLIVTSTDAETTSERDLHAITMSHILRSFKQDTGHDLFEMLSFNPLLTAKSFEEEVAPALTKLLEDTLSGKKP